MEQNNMEQNNMEQNKTSTEDSTFSKPFIYTEKCIGGKLTLMWWERDAFKEPNVSGEPRVTLSFGTVEEADRFLGEVQGSISHWKSRLQQAQ